MTEKTKLTVRVDSQWLRAAKKYASRNNTSLSRLISEYLRWLATEDITFGTTPILNRLTGILPTEVSVKEHQGHLAEKYQG